MESVNGFKIRKCPYCGVYPGQLHHPYLCPEGKPFDPGPDPEDPAALEGEGEGPPTPEKM